MQYISPETVKKFRKELKKEFPDFKLSVRIMNESKVSVAILTAPFQMLLDPEQENENVNQFYIEEHYKDYPKQMKVLKKILQIITSEQEAFYKYVNTGDVPNYYIQISVGRWDRPFQIVVKK